MMRLQSNLLKLKTFKLKLNLLNFLLKKTPRKRKRKRNQRETKRKLLM